MNLCIATAPLVSQGESLTERLREAAEGAAGAAASALHNAAEKVEGATGEAGRRPEKEGEGQRERWD
jgi:hypothetical protein